MVTERKLKILLMWMSVLAMLLIPEFARTQTPLSSYMYLTNFEHTRMERDIIWFWTPDTMFGSVHSNDFIGMKWSPTFYGQVSTTQDRFIFFQANPFFEFRPHFGVPLLNFPDPPEFVGDDGVRIGENDGGMQYRLVMENEFGSIYEWRQGIPFSDELEAIEQYFWEDLDWLYFDSPLEMYGTIDGVATVGSSHNIMLLDNLLYAASEPDFGRFEEEDCDDMLGLISEQNIIIANTIANGRDGGFNDRNRNFETHSIVINGALAAFGESLTFEDQNDEWDRRQGPSPDKRGTIYLKGSLAQFRRGYVHRSNHQGTGYYRTFFHDSRLIDNPPPLFPNVERGDIIGGGSDLVLNAEGSPYNVVGAGTYNNITATAGTVIVLSDSLALTCSGELRLFGTEDNPVIIRRSDPDNFHGYPGLILSTCDTTYISHLQLEDGISLGGLLESGSGVIESCEISNRINISHFNDFEFRDCTFRDTVEVGNGEHPDGIQRVSFLDCEFGNSIGVNSSCPTIEISNCEISENIEINTYTTEVIISHSNIGESLKINQFVPRLLIEDSQVRGSDFSIYSGNTQINNCDIWGDITMRVAIAWINGCDFGGRDFSVSGFDGVEINDCEIQGTMLFSDGTSAFITEGEFRRSVRFNDVMDIEIQVSEIQSGISIQNANSSIINGSLIGEGIDYSSGMDLLSELTVDNNTIYNSVIAGLMVSEVNWFTANNNIFFNNQAGIFVEVCHQDYSTNYNCSFSNTDGHYLGIIHGHFDFVADPMFVNPEGRDFNLMPESPCIDAGNPASSLDPDGTRADVGALPYDHSLSVENEAIIANDFSVSASPNPFNNRTTISFTSRTAGIAEVDIYDLNGRMISSLLREVSRGANNLPLSGHEIGGTGMYFLRIRCDNQSRIVRIIYLP
ncbi:MAG: T9SS type A sorting domain-containing protein [Calditrichaeota bacterium]|nr:T9SS type A sorting domain-containing protein [Calditrichota bacterium]